MNTDEMRKKAKDYNDNHQFDWADDSWFWLYTNFIEALNEIDRLQKQITQKP